MHSNRYDDIKQILAEIAPIILIVIVLVAICVLGLGDNVDASIPMAVVMYQVFSST